MVRRGYRQDFRHYRGQSHVKIIHNPRIPEALLIFH